MVAEPRVELVTPPVSVRPVLDDAQRRAAAPGTGARLVLGAAGSGKTTVLLVAMAEQLEAGCAASQVLGLAPTQTAARRWRSLLAAWTGQETPRVTTLHAQALQLVRHHAALRLVDPPRLLATADQVAVVSEVLRESNARTWPALFREALGTRQFAERVRDFIARAAMAGWTPGRLAAAQHPDLSVWRSIAGVWRRYRRVLALADAIDYAELLHRATVLAEQSGAQPRRLICVDDYAELDLQQVGLLRALVTPASRLIAVTDPDQVADRFRGAAERSVATFADSFAGAGPPVVLTGSYRFGSAVERARVRVSAGTPIAGLPGEVVRRQRAERSGPETTSLAVLTFPDAASEAAAVAAMVRRFATAGLASGGEPRWREAAVMARSARQLAVLEEALVSAGVPVRTGVPSTRLADEPVVAVLTTGLRLACAVAGVPTEPPDGAQVVGMVVSPMGGADPVGLRRLMLALRRAQTLTAVEEGREAASSTALLADALMHPAALLSVDPAAHPVLRRVAALQRRISDAAQRIGQSAPAAEVLWTLWSDSASGPGTWARQLRASALAGGPASYAAHRDLDAAMALFDEAERSPARGGSRSVAELLAAIPALAWTGGRSGPIVEARNAVELTTAHRARGRQWPLVAVAGVQEGVWPSEGGGAGLLGEELLEPGAAGPGLREEHVAAERRLFTLAITRASQRLVVSAVAASERDPGGLQPSRFLADLGVAARTGPVARDGLLTPGGLVADLRRAAVSETSDAAVRAAAVARLAAVSGNPDYPGADPRRWWGVAPRTQAPDPLVPADDPVALSVTGVGELADCPWRWFLTRVLRAGRQQQTAAGIGRLVHRVHEAWSNGEISRDLPAAAEVVERVWASIPFEAGWYSARRRDEVMQSLVRLLAWQQANAERIAFAERSFVIEAALPGGETVLVRGTADIGLAEGGGGLAVLDLKTAKSAPTRADVARHVQLAGYQWAVLHGGLTAQSAAADTLALPGTTARADAGPAEAPDGAAGSGGAPVVTARCSSAGAGLLMASIPEAAGSGYPKVLWQPPMEPGAQERSLFEDVLTGAVTAVRAEDFPAIASPACRTCPVSALCPVLAPGQGVGPR